MSLRKLTILVTHEMEIEVDSRVTDEAIRWRVYQTFAESSDGRQPFSTEMAQNGIQRCVESLAHQLQDSVASAIVEKYLGRGAAWRSTEFIRKAIGEPKVGYSLRQRVFIDSKVVERGQ